VTQTDKGVNWVFLRANLGMKPKFNDPVIPAGKPGTSVKDSFNNPVANDGGDDLMKIFYP